jgi:hypothetical protein
MLEKHLIKEKQMFSVTSSGQYYRVLQDHTVVCSNNTDQIVVSFKLRSS